MSNQGLELLSLHVAFFHYSDTSEGVLPTIELCVNWIFRVMTRHILESKNAMLFLYRKIYKICRIFFRDVPLL